MKYPRVKAGLILVIIGLLCIITGTVTANIYTYIKQIKELATVSTLCLICGGIVELIGIILCGTSKSVYFTRALICIIIDIVLFIGAAVLSGVAVSTTEVAQKALYVTVTCLSLLAIFFSICVTICMIKGCGEVSTSTLVKKLSMIVLIFVGLMFICDFVLTIMTIVNLSGGSLNGTVVKAIAYAEIACNALYAVGYFILLCGAAKTVK